MRLSNASFAYFGLFLSVEMQRLGHLQRLYTNLPRRHLKELPKHAYRSMPLLAAPLVARRLGFPALADRINTPARHLFDRWVAASLEECDIFHCFSGFGLRSFQAAKRRFGAVTVVERGSSHIRSQRALLTDEYARWGQKFDGIHDSLLEQEEAEYEVCDRVMVQSSFAEQTFIDQGISAAKLMKLPLGVDLQLFRPAPKRDDTFRVLYAGHCSLRKGIPYLLEAVAGLRLKNFELAINGGIGDDVSELMKRHSSNFRFLGFQPLDRLHETYSQASVLVLPTIEDGYARVVTEAMACGVPVIATTNCAAPDVLSDGVEGFIVPIRDSDAIRDRIVHLYENPQLREQMGRAALRRAQELIDFRSYGVRAAALYEHLLASVRGAQHDSSLAQPFRSARSVVD